MFKLSKLVIYDFDGHEYTYHFEYGINYFQGENNTGKTEFYTFLDYMFGASDDIRKKPWYRNTLSRALLEIHINGIKINLVRTHEPETNYIYYCDEEIPDSITLREYKEKVNILFAPNASQLRDIHKFTEEELTYRTFTMFNFLGEKRQGVLHDFLDKCSDIKYSVRISAILNFIFNSNLEQINQLQAELEDKQELLKKMEAAASRYSFICTQVNKNLHILDTKLTYTGTNASDILETVHNIKLMLHKPRTKQEENIAELEIIYNNISEKIKAYENTIADVKQLENSSKNRKLLLDNLSSLAKEHPEFSYLTEPIQDLLNEMDSAIAFSRYTISDHTVEALRKQREKLKRQIRINDSRFECYTVEKKAKAISLIEEYLSADLHDNNTEINKLRKEIWKIKEQIKLLQNADDRTKIDSLSDYITSLYESARSISSVVEYDSAKNGFRIQYIKKGNMLQPMIKIEEETEFGKSRETNTNYYVGSLARHTLIQLCGYFAFLKLLIAEQKYPLIPILIIDHISKPFDIQNAKALGQVINQAIVDIGKENLQIFIFDHADYDSLALNPDHFENLATETKTGFNPFYNPNLAE